MSIKGREELHRFAQSILGAFLVSAKQEGLGEEAKSFLASDRCAELVHQFLGNLTHAVASEMAQERRADPFRRLMVHPLTELLEAGGVSRALLPNYFNFLHLVLGDDGQADLTRQCEAILDEVKGDPHFTWDFFYDDPRARALLWTVLMRIADAFKRFEPRRDWFIELMQNRTHAVSVGPNAFVPLAHNEEEDKAQFGMAEFNRLFTALYRPLLWMAAGDDAAFTRAFGAPPAKLIAPFVEKLV
jgi:hypothetical protein